MLTDIVKKFSRSLIKTARFTTMGLYLATSAASCSPSANEDYNDNSSEECRGDYDCWEPEICERGRCVEADDYGGGGSSNPGNGNNGDDGFDVCDGIDNDGNGVIDELGCGKVYFYDFDKRSVYYVDLTTLERTDVATFKGEWDTPNLNFRQLSPDATKITTVESLGQYTDLIYLDLQTERIVPIIEGMREAPYSPAWLTNNEIVFYWVNFDTWNDTIHQVRSDGSGLRELYQFSGERIYRLAPSPDGQKIVFDGEQNGNKDIYVVNTNGSNLRRLTTNPLAEGFLSWFGNDEVLFIRRRERGSYNNNLYSVSINGGNEQLISELVNWAIPNYDSSKILITNGGSPGNSFVGRVLHPQNGELYSRIPVNSNSALSWRE